MNQTDKPMINLIFAGHVDHGKSTLIGRLFYELGLISDRMLERLKRHAEAAGKPSFHFAFFTDAALQERERGITVETAYKGLTTAHRRFNIIDAPGHKDFVKNMVTGASEADAAVLVVDAPFTANSGLAPQTREHLVLLKALGIWQIIVALNKVELADEPQDVCEYCRLEVQDFLDEIDLDPTNDVPWVPLSALHGDNVVSRSDRTPWYEGPTLMEAIDALEPPQRPVDLPLRMPILRTFTVAGIGSVVAGRIETGTVRPGDEVLIAPYPGTGGARAQVGSIEWQHEPVDQAIAGDDVGLTLTRQQKGFVSRQVRKGAVLGTPDHPPRAVTEFAAELLVLDHPSGFSAGYAPYLHVHQAAMPCSITSIEAATDGQGRPKAVADGTALVSGDRATVRIRPHRPLVIEPHDEGGRLGRFVLRDGRTIAAGLCVAVELADDQAST